MTGFAVASGLVGLLATSLAIGAGVEIVAAVIAVGTAWVVQLAITAGLLAPLQLGETVTRRWVLGVGLRLAIFATAWIAAATDAIVRSPVVVFGLYLSVLVILEAIWLARATNG